MRIKFIIHTSFVVLFILLCGCQPSENFNPDAYADDQLAGYEWVEDLESMYSIEVNKPDAALVPDEFQAGERKVLEHDGIKYAFRYCPAGTFTMGTPDMEYGVGGILPGNGLCDVVLTRGFWMLETEVTQAMWKSVMGENPASVKREDLPVDCVNREQIIVFCHRLSDKLGRTFCLPTEAQWEYACRTGTSDETAWERACRQRENLGVHANDLNSIAWYKDNSGGQPHPVAGKQANAWGLYDMHGNVFEHVISVNRNPGNTAVNPTGSAKYTAMCRGGSFLTSARDCRSTSNGNDFVRDPKARTQAVGFRLCELLSPESIQKIPAPILSPKHSGVPLGLPVKLLETLSSEQQDEMLDRVEALNEAASAGDVSTIQELLTQGVIVNRTASSGCTALATAAKNNQPEACELLLKAGSLPRTKLKNQPSIGEISPQEAALEHPKTLKVFLDAGVPLESRGYMGLTLLQLAVTRNYLDSARLLIDCGANTRVKTPKMKPMYGGGESLLDLATSPEMRELLKKAGVKESKKN
ncbi:MAG: SUMF1/EgtB/PvdO family nonheme iron enzyme [Planctomycetia bacterium]|nr:SUMF1/EgtB/PvdO family nonheme iron enzyme [Planctomycetia bacterium]